MKSEFHIIYGKWEKQWEENININAWEDVENELPVPNYILYAYTYIMCIQTFNYVYLIIDTIKTFIKFVFSQLINTNYISEKFPPNRTNSQKIVLFTEIKNK